MKRIELYRIYFTNENNSKEALDIYFKTVAEAQNFCASEQIKQLEKAKKVVFTYAKCNIDIYKHNAQYWRENSYDSFGFEH